MQAITLCSPNQPLQVKGQAQSSYSNPSGLVLQLLPPHQAEFLASAIPLDLAAINCASWGAGTARHWEDERAELVAHARLKIQTGSIANNGHQQSQPAYLAAKLINLGKRYQHLEAGGWRSLSAALPNCTTFDQWKPNQPRAKHKQDSSGVWYAVEGQRIKYEAPPAHPAGGGLLLPQVPIKYWQNICQRQNLPLPDASTVAAGFWQWAIKTPELELLICEGWKKALAAVGAGWAAVALPGVQMGRRVAADGSSQLIAELHQLSCKGRRWLVVFDADAKLSTAAKVSAAAGSLARQLQAVGGVCRVAKLHLLPNTDKTGLDDLLAAQGVAALEKALANTNPAPVLPRLRPADLTAAAGQWLGNACPLPTPEKAPLVVVKAPMGCGKTQATAARIAPLAAAGVPVLMPSHRKALGQAAAEAIGVPWCPAPGSDERQQGVAGCWDSWAPNTALRISGTSYSGGVFVLDEWVQAVEHLLLSTGTALAKRRAEVLRTAAEQLPRMQQVIALDAQLSNWAVELLETLTGKRALVIDSQHQPMQGRPLHAATGFNTAKAASAAFKTKWAKLIDAGQPFLCWTSAQQASSTNSGQTLARLHRRMVPGARVLVVDSSTPEAAALLANNPDAEATKYDAIYCSPAISSGISFNSWKPAAVIAYAGGLIAPEHVAQALARVRCPDVPAYLYAPQRAPGAGLRVGSGATNGRQLIRDLKAIADPLFGQLAAGDADGAWLTAWGELGAYRNRQRFAYGASIVGLLQTEGWAVNELKPDNCPDDGITATELKLIAAAESTLADAQLLKAPPLTDLEANALSKKQRLSPEEKNALQRYQLLTRWANPATASHELLEADRDGLLHRLRLGWLLDNPEAQQLIPAADSAAIAALDSKGMPFEPDRPRVTIGQKLAALKALKIPQLIQRLKAGETIAANDPQLIELHANATSCRFGLTAALGINPAKKASGTARALLKAIGWELGKAGRQDLIRNGERETQLTYTAKPLLPPKGVQLAALVGKWQAELSPTLFAHIENIYGKKVWELEPQAPAPPITAPTAPPATKRLRASWLKLAKAWATPSAPPPSNARPKPIRSFFPKQLQGMAPPIRR